MQGYRQQRWLVSPLQVNNRELMAEVESSQEPLILTTLSRRIAERFEILVSNLCSGKGHAACASLHRHYGAELFRCPVISCSRHRYGFDSRAKRDDHAANHLRLVKCEVVNCDFSSIGFKSEADRADHMLKCHNNFEQQVEVTWDVDDMDDEASFRILCSAAREGELGLVQSLVSSLSRKIVDIGGFGELLRAAGDGRSADIIDMVCKFTAEYMCMVTDVLNQPLRNELQDVLQHAILSGSEDLVRGLCCHKLYADLDARSPTDLTWNGTKFRRGLGLLHLAAHGQSELIFELLLEAGAKVDVPSAIGRSDGAALHWAATAGRDAMVRLLLDRGADTNSKTKNGRTALHMAAGNGHETVVQLLLDRIDIEAKTNDGHTALHRAAGNCHEATMRLLIDHGAIIDSKTNHGDTALHKAAQSGHEAIVRLLIDHGAIVDFKTNDGETALHRAASNGRETTVRLLIDHGANIDSKTNNGYTALYKVAMSGYKAIVRLLIDHGAIINSKTNDGATALHSAAGSDHEAIVRLLIDHGAIVDLKTNDGETALHRAASRGRETTVRLLIDYGANIDSETNNGFTALHSASAMALGSGHEATVRLLLDRGANIEAKDRNGKTALRLAKRWNIAQLLLDRGAASEVSRGVSSS